MSWGNTDDAANSTLWGVAGFKTTANTTTQAQFYNNNVQDANTQVEFIPGMVVGQFGVDVNEMQVARSSGSARPAHAGWVTVKEGTGGRAGRVQMETLVAMSTITGDGLDDDQFPDS